MNMTEKSKQHVDSCRFCWMCHHICPVGNATGQERNTARARALGISLVNRGAMELEEIMDNIYECATCGGCVEDCITGWDPVMFTKEVRLQAAMEGKLPGYISEMLDKCLETGNVYGKTELSAELSAAIDAHKEKTDILLYLGADARYVVPTLAVKAIWVLEKAGVKFTVLEDEPASGGQLDFHVSATSETKAAMEAAAKALDAYKTVIVYDPADAKAIRSLWHEYGVECKANAVTFTAFVAALLRDGKLTGKQSGKHVVFQDPYQLSRDLEETEEPREIVRAYAILDEMLLNRRATVWAGNPLMAEYLPGVVDAVAARRIFNATSVGADTIVTACPGEYAALTGAAKDGFCILSLEDLILA